METAVRTVTAIDLIFRHFHHLTLFIRQFVPLISTHLSRQIVFFHMIDLVKYYSFKPLRLQRYEKKMTYANKRCK